MLEIGFEGNKVVKAGDQFAIEGIKKTKKLHEASTCCVWFLFLNYYFYYRILSFKT